MLVYCSVSDVRGMIKDDALNTLIGNEYIEDAAEREEKIVPIIEGAIVDAEGEIDGYLAKRYSLPLSPVPQVIKKFAKDIAIYNLYSRIGIDENDREKNYLNRYKAAVRFFELVANGKVELGTIDTTQAANNGFKISSNTKLFSRNNLMGM
jgi:phage gp36-like protein